MLGISFSRGMFGKKSQELESLGSSGAHLTSVLVEKGSELDACTRGVWAAHPSLTHRGSFPAELSVQSQGSGSNSVSQDSGKRI